VVAVFRLLGAQGSGTTAYFAGAGWTAPILHTLGYFDMSADTATWPSDWDVFLKLLELDFKVTDKGRNLGWLLLMIELSRSDPYDQHDYDAASYAQL